MHLFYFAMGIGAGDEVIVPAQTHVATAHAVELTGAKVIFAEADEITGNVNLSNIKDLVNERTKAIAVVHYLGVPIDLTELIAFAKDKNIYVVEDCALALGATVSGKHVGLQGDVGVFSFYPVKHITTAEGGMIITKSAELAKKLKHLRAFGVNRSHGERIQQGMYDANQLGFNYRMSEIHAAIGIEQLKKLPDFIERREQNFMRLSEELSKLSKGRVVPQPVDTRIKSSFYCLSFILPEELVTKRASIMEKLKSYGIGSSIYYPNPVPSMTYYSSKYGFQKGDFPIAEIYSHWSIALPVGPHLALDDMSYIGNIFNEIIGVV